MASHSLMPLSDADALRCRREVVNYWDAINQCDDLGGVPGELVRETEIRVTELLQSGLSSDLYEANLITARFECQRQLLSSN